MSPLPSLADASRHAIGIAISTAGRTGATAVAPEHLLVGLPEEPTQEAVQALLAAGVARARLDELAREIPVRRALEPGIGAGLPQSAGTTRAILGSVAEARLDAEAAARPRHLLRALMEDSDSFAARSLLALGVTRASLRGGSPER